MMLTKDQIAQAFPWSKPTELATKRGPRILRKAAATDDARRFWAANKSQLVAAGVAFGKKWRSETEWEFTWWQQIPKEVLVQREKNVEDSRATDAEIDIPCPAGMAYLPFQRAGIAYIIKTFGDKIG